MVYLQGSKLLSRVMVQVQCIEKQELLNQHKAVHPVLNSELRGSMTGEATSLGNIQPASWKLERPTRTMHEAQAANNIRRKKDTLGKFVLTRMLWWAVARRSFSA
ncbi:hypothetical protein OIU74_023264 [Salix koriyanagi]|uniref:Uncharacterized protein n=1 Tax=Salix koriyanagi TaxID=2511006 RepID=A0A9Q0WBQ9_9ROSI|nr:hypothetical protein OIU74_023264 [Salix koriyanagi]